MPKKLSAPAKGGRMQSQEERNFEMGLAVAIAMYFR